MVESDACPQWVGDRIWMDPMKLAGGLHTKYLRQGLRRMLSGSGSTAMKTAEAEKQINHIMKRFDVDG